MRPPAATHTSRRATAHAASARTTRARSGAVNRYVPERGPARGPE
ncbi:hypothetical protein [Streptomyces sp. AN091965]|nr:hypothetical protein [Streptomyces sp. AN091965]